ncbi:MAG: DM13 domain-containing protein [Ilumatobacter sp.]
MKFIRNWKISVPVAGVLAIGLAWLAFGFFGIHTAFIDSEVEEALPEFDVPAAPASGADPESAPADVVETPAEQADAAPSQPADDPVATEDVVDDAAAEESATTVAPPATEPPVTEPAEPVIVTEASGQFTGINDYDVAGDAVILGNGTGQRFLRFENFESDNGPDLNVYLINPDDPSDFIDLGDLKGNIGDQNYELAADIDLDRYSQVGVWCVRFSVGFGTADLVIA